MSGKIFVTGASGNTGGAVLHELSANDADYVACTRNPERAQALESAGHPVVQADFADPLSLASALNGVDAVFLVSAQHPQQAELQGNVVAAAATAGVTHIVKVSGATCLTAEDSGSWVGEAHWKTEQDIAATGIGHTFLRPNYFMQNLLMLVEPIRNGKLPVPLPDQRLGMIDARDVGTVAASVLLDPQDHRDRAYDLTGPEALTFADAAERLTEAVGHPVQHVAPPVDAAVENLKSKGAPDWLQQHFREIMGIFAADASMADVTDSVEQITGRAPRKLDDFVADHVGAFGVRLPA